MERNKGFFRVSHDAFQPSLGRWVGFLAWGKWRGGEIQTASRPSKQWQLFIHSFCHKGVSENRGTPKSSILIGISIIFTIHFGVPLFLETPTNRWFLETSQVVLGTVHLFPPPARKETEHKHNDNGKRPFCVKWRDHFKVPAEFWERAFLCSLSFSTNCHTIDGSEIPFTTTVWMYI